MKRCPECRRDYHDDSLMYCLEDGAPLIQGSVPPPDEPATAIVGLPTEPQTRVLPTSEQFVRKDVGGASNRNSVIAGLIGIVVIAALGIGSYLYYGRSQTKQIGSIAVLPFENRSGTTDSDYLSDGLADSLIYRLSQLPNLKVSPTSSVMRYKGGGSDPSQIAKALNVDAVMAGRLTQIGDSLSISVQLIDARNDNLLWAEQYDRKMSDLLSTQREIAATIAEKLQLKLSGADAKGITKKYTDSNEAYQLYMRGRYSFAKRTKDEMQKAIDYYRQAVSLDPNFALAYARIAEVYGSLPAYPYMSPKEAFPEAKKAAQKALDIDPTLSEAHTFLALSLATYDWNWPEAEREFKRAIELEPNNASAHFRYGQIYLVSMGRIDEALTEIKRGLDGEPLDINMGATYAWALMTAGKLEDGLAQARKAYDLEPTHPIGRWMFIQANILNGKYADAIALDEQWLQADSTNQIALRDAGVAYARAGHPDKANEFINRLREIEKKEYVPPLRIAAIYVALGQKEKAFEEINKAFEVRDWELTRLNVDTYWIDVHDDLRFQELVKKLNLPQ